MTRRNRLKIKNIILGFLDKRVAKEQNGFYLNTLTKHVQKKAGRVAPDSPGRILRELRSYGDTDYIVDRNRSFYYVLWTR